MAVAGKQPTFDWLDAEAADLHCARGLGIWDWASTTDGDPDVVIACAGDVPTIEATIDIEAPVSRVWELVSDLRNMPRWSPQCRKTFVRGGVLKEGAKLRRCRRCNSAMQDVAPTTEANLSLPPWLQAASRQCVCTCAWYLP